MVFIGSSIVVSLVYWVKNSTHTQELKPFLFFTFYNQTPLQICYMFMHNLIFFSLYTFTRSSWTELYYLVCTKKIIKNIFYYSVFGGILSIVFICKSIYFSKTNYFTNYLLFKFYNLANQPLLLRINNKWVANPMYSGRFYTVDTLAQGVINKFYTNYQDILREFAGIKTLTGTLQIQGIKTRHTTFLDLNTKNNEAIYESDYYTAEIKEDPISGILKSKYGLTCVFEKYWGSKKPSTLLAIQADQTKTTNIRYTVGHELRLILAADKGYHSAEIFGGSLLAKRAMLNNLVDDLCRKLPPEIRVDFQNHWKYTEMSLTQEVIADVISNIIWDKKNFNI